MAKSPTKTKKITRTSAIVKNQNKILLVKKYKSKREALKKKFYDKNISINERYKIGKLLNALPRNSSKVRIRNRCFITGRPRGNYRKFGICNSQIRKLAGTLMLPGLTKSSW